MTLWEPRSVVGFAAQAGFLGPDLVDAVHLSWAASRGDDALITGGLHPDASRWHGLFQIPLPPMAHPASVTNLLDPHRNAAVAFAMWRKLGGFGWLPPRTDRVLSDARWIAERAVEAGAGATILTGAAHPTRSPGGDHGPATLTPLGESLRAGVRDMLSGKRN